MSKYTKDSMSFLERIAYYEAAKEKALSNKNESLDEFYWDDVRYQETVLLEQHNHEVTYLH